MFIDDHSERYSGGIDHKKNVHGSFGADVPFARKLVRKGNRAREKKIERECSCSDTRSLGIIMSSRRSFQELKVLGERKPHNGGKHG